MQGVEQRCLEAVGSDDAPCQGCALLQVLSVSSCSRGLAIQSLVGASVYSKTMQSKALHRPRLL